MDQEKATLKKLMLFPRLFRIQDVEKVTPHAAILLSRAFNKGLVYRLTRGSYINSFLKGFPHDSPPVRRLNNRKEILQLLNAEKPSESRKLNPLVMY